MPKYTTKKATVGDLRAVMAASATEEETSFLIAERCILVDGEPIGAERLDALDIETFERLMEEVNAAKKV